jgi:hypothetical protein
LEAQTSYSGKTARQDDQLWEADCPYLFRKEKRPHEPVQAAMLASETGVVVQESIPILSHWKDYKKDDIHYKTFEGQLAVSALL